MRLFSVLLMLFLFGTSYAQEDRYAILQVIPVSKFEVHQGNEVKVFLNEKKVATIGIGERLVYRLYSKGRISVSIVENGLPAVTKSFDAMHDTVYYFLYGNYKKELNGFISKEVAKEINGNKELVRRTITLEEDRNDPVAEDENAVSKTGTGFLIDAKGYIITNYHVIENAKKVHIKGVKGDFNTSFDADLIAADISNDLALLKLKTSLVEFSQPPFSLRTTPVKQGEEVFTLGYPLVFAMGNEVKLTNGVLSANSGIKNNIATMQFSAPVQPGNSGSPLFDKDGNVVGVVSSKLSGAENAGYAIKSNYLSTFLSLIDGYTFSMPKNTLQGTDLSGKVAGIKPYIFVVECE